VTCTNYKRHQKPTSALRWRGGALARRCGELGAEHCPTAVPAPGAAGLHVVSSTENALHRPRAVEGKTESQRAAGQQRCARGAAGSVGGLVGALAPGGVCRPCPAGTSGCECASEQPGAGAVRERVKLRLLSDLKYEYKERITKYMVLEMLASP